MAPPALTEPAAPPTLAPHAPAPDHKHRHDHGQGHGCSCCDHADHADHADHQHSHAHAPGAAHAAPAPAAAEKPPSVFRRWFKMLTMGLGAALFYALGGSCPCCGQKFCPVGISIFGAIGTAVSSTWFCGQYYLSKLFHRAPRAKKPTVAPVSAASANLAAAPLQPPALPATARGAHGSNAS
ncbi:MAG: hypothetical protein ACREJ2_00995 [Planctomycetota bacterium]